MPLMVQKALLLDFGLLDIATAYCALVVASEDRGALRAWFTVGAGACISVSEMN